ncbi:CHAT domain-containing protein [Microcoleus sp. herbarium8]|uniref:CHAT domain-containing protein n=1 Tax=Microcoleus sp. herbarium8 TaxID=3055436 RepID=UPI002FD29A81
MDKQRQEAYLNLIHQLLISPSELEEAILIKNSHLIDAGLIQKLEQEAEIIKKRGHLHEANFLMNIATRLINAMQLSSEQSACLSLIKQVLVAAHHVSDERQFLYLLLQNNIDKLNHTFVSLLKSWTSSILQKITLNAAHELAADIGLFSNFLFGFELGVRAENIEIVITGYEIAAKVFWETKSLQNWANTQYNLGNTYCERIRGDKPDNLELAINHYLAALSIQNRDECPKEWALTKNSLGTAYLERIQEEKAKNLELGIKCFYEALTVHTQTEFPQYFANIKTNLSEAYRNRILGEKADNLEKSIEFGLAALKVYSYEDFPDDWGKTQISLGNAYAHRIRGDKADNLEKAIHYLSSASETIKREKFPQESAKLQHNLGAAYLHRLRGNKSTNREEAISYISIALEVFNRSDFPEVWARGQNSLSLIYTYRIQGDKEENLEKAICYSLSALEVLNRKVFPQYWAESQQNQGLAYYLAYHHSRQSQDIEKEKLKSAIFCFCKALEVRTYEAFPQDHINTQFCLGIAYREASQWIDAYNAFFAAINSIESLRYEITYGSDREEDKQKLAEDWNNLYGCMVEVCLKLDNATEAIEYVERSKTRNLVELILTRDRHTIFPAEVVTQLDRLRDEIASGQYELQNATAEDPTALAQQIQELRQQRNELQDRYLPLGSGFQFDQFRSTLSDRIAIVEFYITTDKLLIFIITKQTQQPIVLSSDLIDLNKLANWANSYLKAYSNKQSHWQRRLTTRLNLLAKILHIDEIIKQIPTECDRLILIPHRYLHLLPLHGLPLIENSSLFDRFPGGLSYAPSCQLLQLAQNRQRPEFTHLFAVQNPTGDLSYTDLEVETIQSYFSTSNLLKQKIATKEAVDDTSLNTVHCAHFSCHGYFNGSEPRKSALILANAELNSTPTQSDAENYLSLTNGGVFDLNKCLTLDSIFTLNLEQCRLVTLSACETGLIDFRNTSDEYIGLPSGFVYAGASSVVSSLWRVNDLSTTFLMIRFYQNLQKGLAVGLALNQAQLWLKDITKKELLVWSVENQFHIDATLSMSLRRKLNKMSDNDKPFELPFHWAAFCAIGQ